MLVSCERRPKPADVNISDQPQSGSRERLAQLIGDLTFVPQVSTDSTIQFLVRGPVRDSSFEVAACVVKASCLSSQMDSNCSSELRFYRWNGEQKSFHVQDQFHIGRAVALRVLPLSHDGEEQVMLTAKRGAKTGLFIFGRNTSGDSIALWHSFDSTVPNTYVLPDHRYALIEQDSSTVRQISGLRVSLPRRFYVAHHAGIEEALNDSVWNAVVQHTRDSTHQIYLLVRDESLREGHGVVGDHALLVQLLLGEALYDSSWTAVQAELKRELDKISTRLTSAEVTNILKLLGTNRLGPFVHVFPPQMNANLAHTIANFDDAIDASNYSLAAVQMDILARSTQDWSLLWRAAKVARDRTATVAYLPASYLFGTLHLYRVASALQPHSAELLRERAYLEQKLGYQDSARVMFQRSLVLDSTSADAQQVQEQLRSFLTVPQ